MRDLAMKFKVINDDRLIIDTKDKELFNTTNLYYIISNSTQKINGLIGENNYEVGVMVTEPAKGVLGIATLGGFYNKSTKGSALVSNNNYTLAHEVGHLFGSKHTFSNGPITYSTEPLSGTSIMGYGFKDDDVFFSLVSASKIKERVFYNPGYYSDEEHKHWVGEKSAVIPFYGINTNNRPPLINRAKLQPEYKIPPDTFFQFRIDATDPEDDVLLYMAHQADIDQPGKANFIAYSPSKDNTVKYEAKYERVLTNPGNDDGEDEYEIQKVPYSSPEPSDRGVYTFWLGVSDGGRKAHQQPHATQYDIEKVNLNIVDGTPFKITSVMPLSNMEEGDTITIKWDVDRNIFGNDTKVRILFSDDYGKTYKYVLADEVPNNGEYKVSLPAGIRKAGKVWSWGSERTKHKVEGIFKVEVIDHIAYALYTRRSLKEPSPMEVYEPKIVFKNLPEPVITVKKNEIPPKAEVTATSSCSGTGNNIPNIDYKEENHLHYILRKWEATDNCGNKNSFTQYIYIEKDRLKFVGDLPKDIHLQCKDSQLPEVPKLEVTGGDESTKIEFTEEKIDLWNGNYKLIRSWYASADKVSPVVHSQVILVQDTTPPELSDYPKDQIVKTEADIPAQQELTAVDNCDGAVKVSQGWEAGELNGKKQKKYVWLAEDRSGNVNRYVQTFTIDPDDTGLSTDEVEVKSLRIYPNPFKDSFVVEGVEGDFNLKIYDLSGKQFKSFGKMQRYIVSDLPAGVYIVNVEADNILHTFKIIKK